MGQNCTTADSKACTICKDEAVEEERKEPRKQPLLEEEVHVPVHVQESSKGLGFREESKPQSKTLNDACCLCWTVEEREIEEEVLLQLHAHISDCIKIFGAQILCQDAACGLIRGFELKSANMSAADTMARLAQLLCRWGVDSGISIFTGIAVGALKTLCLPTDVGERTCYFGNVSAEARSLATAAEEKNMVRIAPKAKEQLQAFKLMAFIQAGVDDNRSYYLDPFSTVRAGSSMEKEPEVDDIVMDETGGKMSFEDFKEYLSAYNIDISRFGRGSAKSLKQFYASVIHKEKERLVPEGGTLARIVDIVRISLQVNNDEGTLVDLRLAYEIQSNGVERRRNQKLAMVQTVPEDVCWDDVIEKCFYSKFGLSKADIAGIIEFDKDSLKFVEEKSVSETIPGIVTTYRVHFMVLNVLNKHLEVLGKIGLPRCTDFVIQKPSDGTGRKYTWSPVAETTEDILMTTLQTHGIDAADFSQQALGELHDEVYEKKLSVLLLHNHELMRAITIVKIWLHVDILNVDHMLVMHSKLEKGTLDDSVQGNALSMRISSDMGLLDAIEECLYQRLGISPEFQEKNLVIDESSHKLTEEIAYSKSFPGLKTLYLVNELHARVSDSFRIRGIGLPSGTDFSFARYQDLGRGEKTLVVTHWSWQVFEDQQRDTIKSMAPTLSDTPSLGSRRLEKRRAPSPGTTEIAPNAKKHELVLKQALGKSLTDWKCAKNAATRIRDPDYSCKNYWEDITSAFPELKLYLLTSENQDGSQEGATTTAGRTGEDEYQRTLGALFAVYWLMRLDIDGKESFCFGLDKKWAPKQPRPTSDGDSDFETRRKFYESADWQGLENLMVSAGMKTSQGTHDVDRTLAMLVLMVIHDIMKLDMLLPTVESKVGSFCGYQAGDVVNDHDVALSYILEHHPKVLPSFIGLMKTQQDAVRFTHCKMEYNMGWLVQGEAPPGPLFNKFREVVISGQASSRDIAFYFVHWFTDLAGAEPCPLEGCEKLVLKFPLKVLKRFIESFAIVQNLSPAKTETKIFEEYLHWRWNHHEPILGRAPKGSGAVAQMRLMLMAQGDTRAMLDAAKSLPKKDQIVLFQEMACTGLAHQWYLCESGDVTEVVESNGPAILVYYGPALLQKAGKKDPKGSLMVLTEVYRQTRALFPLVTELASSYVTVRIDALKELDIASIKQPGTGYVYVVMKSSTVDANVRLLSLAEVKKMGEDVAQILNFSARTVRLVRKRTKTSQERRNSGLSFGSALRRLRTRRKSWTSSRDSPISP